MLQFRRDEEELSKLDDFEVGEFTTITLSTLIGSSVKPESNLYTVAFDIYLRPDSKAALLEKRVFIV